MFKGVKISHYKRGQVNELEDHQKNPAKSLVYFSIKLNQSENACDQS
jgi:hypothetical protein